MDTQPTTSSEQSDLSPRQQQIRVLSDELISVINRHALNADVVIRTIIVTSAQILAEVLKEAHDDPDPFLQDYCSAVTEYTHVALHLDGKESE